MRKREIATHRERQNERISTRESGKRESVCEKERVCQAEAILTSLWVSQRLEKHYSEPHQLSHHLNGPLLAAQHLAKELNRIIQGRKEVPQKWSKQQKLRLCRTWLQLKRTRGLYN